MLFDGTINLGTIIQSVVIIIGGFYFLWNLKSELKLLIQETNIRHDNNLKEFENINKKLEGLSQATIEIARQDERMTSQDIRLNNLAVRLDEYLSKILAAPPSVPRRSKG